jgi:hypothetical protein
MRSKKSSPRKWKIPTKTLSRKLGAKVWAFLYGRNKPLLYLAVPTILTSTFFFVNFALNKRQLDQIEPKTKA